ncbi:MAG: hypothetical protein H6741_30025 [Alphaproteobacteria bacterium]|nr:hypothetical protein [Alphaproteobacteria bacterium]
MSPAERARRGVERWSRMDPAAWGTGLSPEGARRALAEACAAVLRAELSALPLGLGRPPRHVLIWCSGNVFTAALEWTAAFVALGARVTLKAPSQNPEPFEALAEAFAEDVEVVAAPHAACWPLLERADAVLGFGSDAAMRELDAHLPLNTPRSLHGHRVSFAVVRGHSEALADALALDAALYDGRGCLSPAAVLCLGDAEALAAALHGALERVGQALPRGPLTPAQGPEWRTRAGLARVTGRLWQGEAHAVSLAPLSALRPAPLPRFLSVHPARLEALPEALDGLPLSTAGTDLEAPEALVELGFSRVCRPGFMQRPPFPRPHDGVHVLRALCREVSLECP